MPIEVPEKVQQWFEAQNFEVRLFPEKSIKKFQSLSNFYDFIADEMIYWQPFEKRLFQIFNRASAKITEAINHQSNETQFQQDLRSAFAELIVKSKSQGPFVVFSATQFAKDLKLVFEKYGAEGSRAFYEGVLCEKLTGNFGDRKKNEFFGLFDAYVYQRLNEQVTGQIKNGETALTEIQSKFNVFFDQCDGQQSDRQIQFDEFCKAYLEWKSQSETTFNQKTANQLETQQSHFEKEDADWRKRIADLEELYQKKLMLEAPVEYWKELAKKHNIAGHWFSFATALSLVAMVSILGEVLYKWPPAWLQSETWEWNTLKGSFLLLTIASLAIYVVRFLAKFAISSYHLARDAEERKQLTYVYLSLLEKKAVTPEQQQIVLQALFSRADTGLLKGDHGPTMPSVLSNLIEKA